MKNIIIILTISFLASSFTFENEKPQPLGDGSNYHVMALSGLKMRDLPSLKGKKILTIPYNGEVELIDTGENYGELTIQELKDFYIKGEWVKVRYDGKEGFVFNGYLTQFPLPSDNKRVNYDKGITAFYQYFQKKFIAKSGKYNFLKEEKCSQAIFKNCHCGFAQDFTSNIFYSVNFCYGDLGKPVEIIEIENITMTEAYFITQFLEKSDSFVPSYDKYYNLISYYDQKETGATLEIKHRKQNSIEISIWSGC